MPRPGSSNDRGYGPEHRALRAQLQRAIDSGIPTACWRCGTPITGTQWDLGHDDLDRSVYRGAECVRCNRSNGAAHGNRLRGIRRHTVTKAPPIVEYTDPDW